MAALNGEGEVSSDGEWEEGAVDEQLSTDFLRWRRLSIKAIKRTVIYARVKETGSEKFVAVRKREERLMRRRG